MPVPDLRDTRVLVTRPVHQAQVFIKKLQAAGAQTTEFPCIDIRYRQLPSVQIRQALQSDLLIFTSANAVTGAIKSQLFDNPQFTSEEPTEPMLAAIGRATLQRLQDQQLTVVLAPAENTDSEGFVAQFKDTITPDSSITIVRGEHGRDVLKQQLESLGAKVSYLSVYDQRLPQISKTDALSVLTGALPCTISITSNLGLRNLLQLAPAETRPQLLACPLVVNSLRCAKLAESLGFKGPVAVASPPGDYGQIVALSTL